MMEILRLKKKLQKSIPRASKSKDCPGTLNGFRIRVYIPICYFNLNQVANFVFPDILVAA